jgi:hypothetical protein
VKRALGIVVVAAGLLLAWVALREPAPVNRPPPTIVHFARGAKPVRAYRTADQPPEPPPSPRSAPPAPVASEASPSSSSAPAPEPVRRSLDDLAPEVRGPLTTLALQRLHELVDACESTVSDPEDLGAFVVLDHQGVAELDIRAIATAPGPIEVQERELPQPLVDCLDDALWEQDWSGAGPAVPEGTELPIALTLRLE